MSVTYQDIIPLPLTEQDILQAIDKARQCRFLNNLRHRHPTIEFDCKVRGFIAEIAFQNWLATYNIHFQQTNYFLDTSGMDIDFLYVSTKGILQLELKTSLIPDEWRSLQNCIAKGDIKLIRRGRKTIEQLQGDIHIQVYYRQRRKVKERWLATQQVDLQNWRNTALYESILGRAYLDNIFVVGWIDKRTLVTNLADLPISQSTWRFSGSNRNFWKCNIASQAYAPVELINLLKALPTSQVTTKVA